ncbi:2'-5' RNA ligase family protein [Microbacterium sp. VKM Ac-2923]|uniref:2'-5' RNA ligase family protein n=1 Tax=Microbacterium sp. VKM Ac-2923 TaxID=2929476 RepID=UPI001FB4C059|nr:2'-5' RNA ligase family protein [Microbacterium sp. VKM Ac-2923]MCJ1706377.1 2'-5' RNA ligase family protein [Microbacterium sp. VKM Ac-2923]
MSDVVSLELVFDDASEAAVRREWDALVAADLPSQARHTGASNRPHITLLVRPALGDPDLSALAARLPLQLTLGAPLIFGTGRSRVIARSVVPSVALLDLHSRIHALAGPGDDAVHTRPGSWTAHVTLARRVPLDSLGKASGVLAEAGEAELAVTATGVRRWDSASRTVSDPVSRGTLETC